MIDTRLCRDVLFEFPLKFWNTFNIGIPVEVYNRVDRFLTGLAAQRKETAAR